MGSSPTTGTILTMLKIIPLTYWGALRRAAERCRQGNYTIDKKTGAFVIPLTTLEFVALDCPNGQTIKIMPEAMSMFDKPTLRDMMANCWERG